MRFVLWLIVIALALWALDRVLVWCELRGWIYYRLTPRQVRSSIGNTLLAVEELYRPSRRHVIELRQEEAVRREEDDEGGTGPGEGSGARSRDTIARPAVKGTKAAARAAGSSARRRRPARKAPRPRGRRSR